MSPRSHDGSLLLDSRPPVAALETVQDQAICHSLVKQQLLCTLLRQISRLAASRTPCGTF